MNADDREDQERHADMRHLEPHLVADRDLRKDDAGDDDPANDDERHGNQEQQVQSVLESRFPGQLAVEHLRRDAFDPACVQQDVHDKGNPDTETGHLVKGQASEHSIVEQQHKGDRHEQIQRKFKKLLFHLILVPSLEKLSRSYSGQLNRR
ncbi:hypothetical protein OMP38_28000 [Cohnella ginsengisoli]|uniref:Uncharacterized protein n=1 Tax=Cohnella ginsengisoli TaxID=425004 RepID=A0A9X4KRB2_9BACL|nr:hypothetical protein [Cohnella ginsengisoli]MDG0794250.1 hypothetical protein [Cohnella ginsengisoli]